jgi:hypothetical protein
MTDTVHADSEYDIFKFINELKTLCVVNDRVSEIMMAQAKSQYYKTRLLIPRNIVKLSKTPNPSNSKETEDLRTMRYDFKNKTRFEIQKQNVLRKAIEYLHLEQEKAQRYRLMTKQNLD